MQKAQQLVGVGKAPEERIPSGVGESVPVTCNHKSDYQDGIRGVVGHLSLRSATRQFREFEVATEAGLWAHQNEGD